MKYQMKLTPLSWNLLVKGFDLQDTSEADVIRNAENNSMWGIAA